MRLVRTRLRTDRSWSAGRAQPAFGDRPANDLLGAAESIDRGRVDKVDAMLERGLDGSDRFSFVGSTPHPPADGPSPNSNGRHLERRAGNVGTFHVHFESLCLTSHDPVLSLSACALRVWVADKSNFNWK